MAVWFRDAGRTRFTPEHLWKAVAAVSPSSSGTGERPRILHAVLGELRDAGVVALGPPGKDPPYLPTRVTLLRKRPRPARVAARPEPWLLSGISPRRPDTTLGQVNRWVFRHRAAAVEEPRRERALEITGDEKAFDRLGSGIDPLALDEILMTYPVEVPLDRRRRVGTGPVLLVVENVTTFDSVTRVLRAAPGGPIGEVVWGGGGAFESSVRTLLDDPPSEIRYFGDLDADGLRIPAAASVTAERIGLPPIRPATGLYTMLLAHGKRQERASTDPRRAVELATWLDPAHRDAVSALLADGRRYAQEACRRSLLTVDDTWRLHPA